MGGEARRVLGRGEFSMRSMRALSFFFALMVGLVLAFLAPAMAGGEPTAPEAMVVSQTSPEAFDALAIELLPSPELDAAPGVDEIA